MKIIRIEEFEDGYTAEEIEEMQVPLVGMIDQIMDDEAKELGHDCPALQLAACGLISAPSIIGKWLADKYQKYQKFTPTAIEKEANKFHEEELRKFETAFSVIAHGQIMGGIRSLCDILRMIQHEKYYRDMFNKKRREYNIAKSKW